MTGKRVTLREIAAETGLGVSTVSYVLMGKGLKRVSEENQRRVREAARRLNYTPNLMARGLRSGSSRFVGALVPELATSFMPEILTGMDDTLASAGYSIILCSFKDGDNVVDKVRRLLDHQVDGLIVRCWDAIGELEAVLPPGFPMVWVARPPTEAHPAALSGPQELVDLTLDTLWRYGHRRIAFAMTQLTDSRCELFTAGVARRGGPPPVFLKEAIGEALLERMLSLDATALVAADPVAIEVLLAARAHGVRIPERFSVFGNDGLPEGRLTTPGLTTGAQLRKEQGIAAAEMLLQWIRDGKRPETTVLRPFLVERGSVARIGGKPTGVRPCREDA